MIKITLGRKKAHAIYSVPESVALRIHTRLLHRASIERGWQQAQAGHLIDGDDVFTKTLTSPDAPNTPLRKLAKRNR